MFVYLYAILHGLYLSLVYFESESMNQRIFFILFQDSFGYPDPDHFIFSYEFKIQFFLLQQQKVAEILNLQIVWGILHANIKPDP